MSLIISRVDYPVTIDVVGPDGATDSVNLQGHGRITLPEGYVLDPRMATFYKARYLKADSIGVTSTPKTKAS